MAITLNHTIVPARDKEASAKFLAHMFGLKYEGATGHFAAVRINETQPNCCVNEAVYSVAKNCRPFVSRVPAHA